jgi:hypothetical protein
LMGCTENPYCFILRRLFHERNSIFADSLSISQRLYGAIGL